MNIYPLNPTIGDNYIAKSVKYIYHSCEVCGNGHWATVVRGKPRAKRCKICGIKSMIKNYTFPKGTIEHPEVGDIRRGDEVKKGNGYFIWRECSICKTRCWTSYVNGVTRTLKCSKCTINLKNCVKQVFSKGTIEFPISGDERRGIEIGKSCNNIYIYKICPVCNKGRWLQRSERKFTRKCPNCRYLSTRTVRYSTGGYRCIKLNKTDKFYCMVMMNGGYILEHRYVMAKILNRPLEVYEQPHHKNGNKLDNSPENLELRIGAHGKGASLKDYENELLKRIKELYKENQELRRKNE